MGTEQNCWSPICTTWQLALICLDTFGCQIHAQMQHDAVMSFLGISCPSCVVHESFLGALLGGGHEIPPGPALYISTSG